MNNKIYGVVILPWNIWKEVKPEEEDKLIEDVAELISNHELETMSLLVLNTIKPLVYVGGELGRFFIAPLLPFLNHKADAVIYTFEQRKNIDKLINMIERKLKEEDTNKNKAEKEKTHKKRFWPF